MEGTNYEFVLVKNEEGDDYITGGFDTYEELKTSLLELITEELKKEPEEIACWFEIYENEVLICCVSLRDYVEEYCNTKEDRIECLNDIKQLLNNVVMLKEIEND